MKDKVLYPVVCHFEDGSYWSEFPDLPGCFSQGNTEQEIVMNSRESMEGYLISLLESGADIPEPSKITDIKIKSPDFCTYVEGDLTTSTKYVRKNVTIPEWLSKKAEKKGVNFSHVLQEGLLRTLA